MGLFSRFRTDPASVNHEADWGLWDWSWAGAIALLATGLVVLGCAMTVWTVRRGIDLDRDDALDGAWAVWVPLVKLLAQGLGAFVACFAGVALLPQAVHDMARHTASMWWVVVLVVGVYALAYLALRTLGLWVASGFSPDSFDDRDEGLWWTWITRVIGCLYLVLAVINLAIEGLNKVSGAAGLAISVLLGFGVCVALWIFAKLREQR